MASGNQEGGRIHLVHVADKTTSVLFPTPDRMERLDAATYPSCPGPLDPQELDQDEFRAHGLYLEPGAGDVHDLYVVHHGRRESIEVFELDAGAAPMTLTWVGCAVAPEGAPAELGGGASGGRLRRHEHVDRRRLGVEHRRRLVRYPRHGMTPRPTGWRSPPTGRGSTSPAGGARS